MLIRIINLFMKKIICFTLHLDFFSGNTYFICTGHLILPHCKNFSGLQCLLLCILIQFLIILILKLTKSIPKFIMPAVEFVQGAHIAFDTLVVEW